MKNVWIVNPYPTHLEIIESVIENYPQILGINEKVHVYVSFPIHPMNLRFDSYIQSRYPDIQLIQPDAYDYYIHCTIYDKHRSIIQKKMTHHYIAHEITEELQSYPNVWFLTPLARYNYFYAKHLPYSTMKKRSSFPVYIVQGQLNDGKRDWNSLVSILKNTYEYPYQIKLLGRGKLPRELEPYRDQLIVKTNLNFEDYHREFLDGYCILTLTTKKLQPYYYTKKLTSTISYALGYHLLCLLDTQLQDIYKLSNHEVYDKDIVASFKKTLHNFYK